MAQPPRRRRDAASRAVVFRCGSERCRGGRRWCPLQALTRTKSKCRAGGCADEIELTVAEALRPARNPSLHCPHYIFVHSFSKLCVGRCSGGCLRTKGSSARSRCQRQRAHRKREHVSAVCCVATIGTHVHRNEDVVSTGQRVIIANK